MKNKIELILLLFALLFSIYNIAFLIPDKLDQVNLCIFIIACIISVLNDKK